MDGIAILERVEQDEQLSRELESDGHFDEPEVEDVSYPASSSSSDDFIDGEPIPTPSRLPPSGPPGLFSPLSTTTAIRPPPPPRPTPRWEHPGAAVPPPAQLLQQPPLLLVPFVNLVGIKLIPSCSGSSSTNDTKSAPVPWPRTSSSRAPTSTLTPPRRATTSPRREEGARRVLQSFAGQTVLSRAVNANQQSWKPRHRHQQRWSWT